MMNLCILKAVLLQNTKAYFSFSLFKNTNKISVTSTNQSKGSACFPHAHLGFRSYHWILDSAFFCWVGFFVWVVLGLLVWFLGGGGLFLGLVWFLLCFVFAPKMEK